MQTSPRYFPGRMILVKTHVQPLIESPHYSTYDASITEKYVTHNAKLVGREGNDFIVEVANAPDLIKVPVKETLELNQPHIFPFNAKGKCIFEDNLEFKSSNLEERAQLIKMALAIAPIAAKINFGSPDCLQHQLEAMTAIRNCCDFIANNVGTNKIMDPMRKVTGTVGKISIKG
jgi:hypothetical protein